MMPDKLYPWFSKSGRLWATVDNRSHMFLAKTVRFKVCFQLDNVVSYHTNLFFIAVSKFFGKLNLKHLPFFFQHKCKSKRILFAPPPPKKINLEQIYFEHKITFPTSFELESFVLTSRIQALTF